MSDAQIEHTPRCEFLLTLDDKGLEETLMRLQDELPAEIDAVVNSPATYWEIQGRLNVVINNFYGNCDCDCGEEH